MPDREPEYVSHDEEYEEREIDTMRARQAVALGRIRYALAISIALVALLFVIIYFAGP